MGASGSKRVSQHDDVLTVADIFQEDMQSFSKPEVKALLELLIALSVLKRHPDGVNFHLCLNASLATGLAGATSTELLATKTTTRTAGTTTQESTSSQGLAQLGDLDCLLNFLFAPFTKSSQASSKNTHESSRLTLVSVRSFITRVSVLFKRPVPCDAQSLHEQRNLLHNIFGSNFDEKTRCMDHVCRFAMMHWPSLMHQPSQRDNLEALFSTSALDQDARFVLHIVINSLYLDFFGFVRSYCGLDWSLPSPLPLPHLLVSPKDIYRWLINPLWIFFLVHGLPFFREPLTIASLQQWTLVWSSESPASASWLRFVDAVSEAGPLLVLIRDLGGALFGGLIDKACHVSSSFQGGPSSAVFRLSPRPMICVPSGYNDHFFYLNSGMQSFPSGMGMGGHLGFMTWFLDASLKHGHSEAGLVTFSPSEPLASASPFTVHTIEIWALHEEALADKAKKKQQTRTKASVMIEQQDVLEMVHMSRPPAYDPSVAYDDSDLIPDPLHH